MWGQSESVFVKLTDSQRDSLITRIQRATSFIANQKLVGGVGRYKIYPTTNIYTSLKLDTASGRITALQISLGDTFGIEYDITDAVVPDGTIIGRFELYPTKNNFNFILLDTIFGYAYQVQWSTNSEECMIIPLW